MDLGRWLERNRVLMLGLWWGWLSSEASPGSSGLPLRKECRMRNPQVWNFKARMQEDGFGGSEKCEGWKLVDVSWKLVLFVG